MDVSIIIINYKSKNLVMDCIASIYRETKTVSFEIIVVDNNSRDHCLQAVQQYYPAVIWLPLDYNAGFARANNAGISIAKGEYVLLLNADTIILDNAIDKSLHALRLKPDAVGAGVQLLNLDGTNQISGAHFIKGGLNTLLLLPYLGTFIRSMAYRLASSSPSVQTITSDISVDWVTGAYMLINSNIIKLAGMFDNDFFMYAEEIEWCSRLIKYGKLYLLSSATVMHIGGGLSADYYSIPSNANNAYLWNKMGRQKLISNMLRIRKQYGCAWFMLISSIHLLEIFLMFMCLLFETVFRAAKTSYTWKNWLDYNISIFVFLTYFFRILLNKPYFYKVA